MAASRHSPAHAVCGVSYPANAAPQCSVVTGSSIAGQSSGLRSSQTITATRSSVFAVTRSLLSQYKPGVMIGAHRLVWTHRFRAGSAQPSCTHFGSSRQATLQLRLPTCHGRIPTQQVTAGLAARHAFVAALVRFFRLWLAVSFMLLMASSSRSIKRGGSGNSDS